MGEMIELSVDELMDRLAIICDRAAHLFINSAAPSSEAAVPLAPWAAERQMTINYHIGEVYKPPSQSRRRHRHLFPLTNNERWCRS